MRAIGVIPARMASTRFPGKPLAPIAGKPMLRHVWDAAKGSLFLEPVFVATADPEIINWCEFAGIKYLITRSDCRNGTERCHDAMRQLKNLPDDIVVNVQGDEPTIRPEALDELARAFYDPGVKIASLYFKPDYPGFISDRNRVKVLVSAGGHALAFSRTIASTIQWRSYGQHIGVYAYRREVLAGLQALPVSPGLEQEAWMEAGYKIKMAETPWSTQAVDSPGDIKRVEALMAE